MGRAAATPRSTGRAAGNPPGSRAVRSSERKRVALQGVSNPAFTSEEVGVVRDWVAAGGALLLVADHYPFGASAAALGAALGVKMHQGFVQAPDSPASVDESDTLLFSRGNELLSEHAITRGASTAERVERVMTFTGQSLEGPPGSSLLVLPPSAEEAVPPPPVFRGEPAGGRSQGLAFAFGRGRVVVLADAAMLTAQVAEGRRFGMNGPGNDNRQFALNVLHWLSRAL